MRRERRKLVSLFAGAGGLDLGLEVAGFTLRLAVEVERDARQTLQLNRPTWKLSVPGDLHRLPAREVVRQAGVRRASLTLLAAGPPCQPWSKSGLWSAGGSLRSQDPRSRTLRAVLKVVREAKPQVILIENVVGVAHNGHTDGFRALERGLLAINRVLGTNYQPQRLSINAADYGAPQFRERVFLIAHKGGRQIKLPKPTHGPGAKSQFCTAWDAIGHLDRANLNEELQPSGKWAGLLPSIPEGMNYLWHTHKGGGEPLFGWRTRFWSFLLKLAKNKPSWTIQADPGPATGPFHWSSRLLSIEELCALQTFPGGYKIVGSRHSAHRQVGNAVPCILGEFLGLEIRRQLLGERRVRKALRLALEPRDDCPRAHRRGKVKPEFRKLRGKHKEHPGAGLGPAPRSGFSRARE